MGPRSNSPDTGCKSSTWLGHNASSALDAIRTLASANVEVPSYSAATSAQHTIALHTVLQRPNPLYICAAT